MKVIKPFRLSVVTRPYEVRRVPYFGISTLAFFDLSTCELLPEVALWQFVAEQLGEDAAIEAGVPKSYSEFLISGSVFTPGHVPAETCPAVVRVGDTQKTIYAIGDRFWNHSEEQSKPRPFAVMPLTWDRAFGGPGYPDNEGGMGVAPVETKHGMVQFLPNFELPGRMISAPKDRPPPAGFGPFDLTRPQRLRRAGTYDREWLKELFPGLAADIDWRFWNLAPDDQQRQAPWNGDETFELRNVHPDKPVLQGRLPGLRARTFVTLPDAEGRDAVHDLEAPLRTIWLFPHAEKGILIYQTAIQTREDDGTDVSLLMVAADLLSAPRDRAHYQEVLARRLDKDLAVFQVLKDEDLLPPELIESFETKDDIEAMKELVTRDGVLEERGKARLAERIDEARALIASHGLDPDQHGPSHPAPTPTPSIEELPALMAKLEAEVHERKAAHAALVEAKLREVEPMIASHGVDPSFIRQEVTQAHVGPPRFTALGELARIRGLDAQSRAKGVVLDELVAWCEDEALFARWQGIERSLRDTYVFAAHMQPAALRLAPDEAARVRAEVLAALHAGEPFAHKNLTGADLSGMDLRGADFRRGWLESTNLAGSNLEGARCDEAVFARADLTGATLHRAVFHAANFGRATMKDVRAAGADFEGAILQGADLEGADFTEARLDDANLSEARFRDTRFDRISAKGLTFLKTDVRGASFAGARLDTVTFIECDLSGVDLSGALLEGVSLVQCRGEGIKLAGATTKKLVVCLAEPFDRAVLTGARLESANLRGVSLRGADLSEAVLDGADLSETDLTEARLYRAVARNARFAKANLTGADLTAANLMGADLAKSDLSSAKLIGANLYGASFARVRSDTATVLTDALQTKVTIYPLWRPPA